jgi:hypothetical protein
MQCGKLTSNKCLREFVLLSPAPPDTAAKLSKTLRLLSFKEKERMKVHHYTGWDLAEWLERCASIPKITGSNPSGGSESQRWQ